MKNSPADKLKKAMEPGRVCRRHELEPYCGSLGRSLNKLVEQGEVVREAFGLYYRPRMTSVGPAPATSKELVRAFLSEDAFLFVSFNEYNLLGLGLTQLYNQQFVCNSKRNDDLVFDGKRLLLRKVRDFPKKLTKEFLLVELLNNRKQLSGNTRALENAVARKAKEADRKKLFEAARKYGNVTTRKFYEEIIER